MPEISEFCERKNTKNIAFLLYLYFFWIFPRNGNYAKNSSGGVISPVNAEIAAIRGLAK